jgi:CBS domain-containing protein
MDKIYQYMNEKIHTIEHNTPVKAAAISLRDGDTHSLLVTLQQEYVGIITEVDIARKVVAEGLDPNETTVSAIMEKNTIKLDKKLPMPIAFKTMKDNDIRHILVTDESKIAGILSIKDFSKFYCGLIKDPIIHFWSNYECLLDETAFNEAIEKLLTEIIDFLGEESKTAQAIKNSNSRAEIIKFAEQEGLEDLKQILQLQAD